MRSTFIRPSPQVAGALSAECRERGFATATPAVPHAGGVGFGGVGPGKRLLAGRTKRLPVGRTKR